MVMNYKEHFKYYRISLVGLYCLFGFLAYLKKFSTGIWFNLMIGLCFGFFIINPDIDLLFGIKNHRSALTHSIIYPLALYWGMHPFWNMEHAKLWGTILFFPVLIHLFCDFQLDDILDETKGKGSWCVTFGFFSGYKRLSKKATEVWILVNIILICIYLCFVWFI